MGLVVGGLLAAGVAGFGGVSGGVGDLFGDSGGGDGGGGGAGVGSGGGVVAGRGWCGLPFRAGRRVA